MKMVIIAIVVFLTIGISLAIIIMDQFGVERNYLLIGLAALVITALVAFRGVALIAIILIMSLAINMPEEMLAEYYLDRDILIVVVIMMVLFPLIYREFAGKK